MGAPRKQPLLIRLSDNDKAFLQRLADAHSVSLAAALRMILRGQNLTAPVRVRARAATPAPAADPRQRSLFDLLAEGNQS